MAAPLTVEENIFLAKRNVVDSIYREARLENINVTFPQTQEIFENRTVSGVSVGDTIVINNLKHAWSFVLTDIYAPLSLDFLCKIHSLIGAGLVLDAGGLRNGKVGVAGTNWQPPVPTKQSASALLEELQSSIPSQKSVAELYAKLAKAQLFWDGNKRTAQLAANKALIMNGLGVFSVPTDRIMEFNELSVAYYGSDNLKPLVEFILEHCITTINR